MNVNVEAKNFVIWMLCWIVALMVLLPLLACN